MKKIVSILSLLLLAAVSGCNRVSDDERWYDGFPDGGLFTSGNFMRFVYVDNDGRDLVDPSDLSTLPVASRYLLDAPPEIPLDYDPNTGRYGDDMNDLAFNQYRGYHEYFTWAYGDSRRSDYTFYVYFKGVPDKMEVRFKYRNYRNADGYYSCTIVQWKVNGVTVYPRKDSDTGFMRYYVYLRKSADGSTSVEFEP